MSWHVSLRLKLSVVAESSNVFTICFPASPLLLDQDRFELISPIKFRKKTPYIVCSCFIEMQQNQLAMENSAARTKVKLTKHSLLFS